MMNGRVWLSFCALAFGAMAMMALISLEMRDPFDFSKLSSFRLTIYFALLVGPIFYWLYIFFRRRGMQVIMRSRPQLSLSAFLLGEMLALTMTSLRIVTPIPFAAVTTLHLIFYIATLAALGLAWAILFFRRATVAPAMANGQSA